MRLLLFIDWFLPGYKAGGQISSCANIIHALKDEPWEIYVITRDRDLDDEASYAGITADEWTVFRHNTKVIYLSPAGTSYGIIRKLVKEINPDTVYFNSMFSYKFTLMPLWVVKNTLRGKKVILAPRGMLQSGALQFGSFKKRAALSFLYYSGLLKNILFHATDEVEVADIKKNIHGVPRVKLVYDFPTMLQAPYTGIEKQAGSLKCLFISRVVGKKNLLYLLQVLAETTKKISLTIVGPVEDKEYWQQCRQQINTLPANCTVDYKGSVPNIELGSIYREHHLFVLPTRGENFGHVIFDSFLNGRPVLTSDQTPWRGLEEKKLGFDIALAEKTKFKTCLEYVADMGLTEFDSWSRNAWLFGQEKIKQLKDLTDEYKSLFN